MSKIKLFCFPYAGGSATIYNKWKNYVRADIEVVPVELSGRGRRIHETLYKGIPDAIDDVFNVIRDNAASAPYALVGHSMGAMISYHLAQKIRNSGMQQPLHIFFSGRGAPGIERKDKKKYSLMTRDEFVKEVIDLGGTSDEFFKHPELLELFLPLLRNDFRLSESENWEDEIVPLDNDITVFLGKDEDLTDEQCTAWKRHTKKICNTHYFNGGHFFIHDETERIAAIINSTLKN
jgi:medium-chain acyl-[acyl-carrier-protein] hydrolase